MHRDFVQEEKMSLFWKVFGVILLAEMGDKSQLLTVALASRFRVREIFTGASLAILVLNALAVAVGAILGELLPMGLIGLCAGLAFLYFSVSSFLPEGEEERSGTSSKRGAVLTVFGTFFLSELGDKTQLTTLTFAIDRPDGGIGFLTVLAVFLGATAGLLVADLLGLSVGLLLNKKMPYGVFSRLSGGVFALFGMIRLLEFSELLFAKSVHGRLYAILLTVAICIGFLVFGFCKYVSKRNVSYFSFEKEK